MNIDFDDVSADDSPAAAHPAGALVLAEAAPLAQPQDGPACEARPREVLLATLASALPACFASGDVEAARVIHEAIGRLLGVPGTAGAVVDLAVERERRATHR